MKKTKFQRILSFAVALMMALTMIISSTAGAFAVDETGATFTEVKLGSKKSITIKTDSDDNFVDQYYKITIPKAGKYKIYMYNSYHDSFNDDFWIGVYGSKANALNQNKIINELLSFNHDNPLTDYSIYNLKAKTYYLRVQGFDSKRNKTGFKVEKVTENDLWRPNIEYSYFAGEEIVSAGVYKETFSDKIPPMGKVTSVTTSNKKVVKVTKSIVFFQKGKKGPIYSLKFKKAGNATITIKYTRPNGKKATIKKKVLVKKYPAHIKSLKVCGKAVKTSKNKYQFTLKKYKKNSVTTNIKLKKGWEVSDVYVDYYTKNKWVKGNSIKTSLVTKGKKISFPKKYAYMSIDIGMTNDKGDFISYMIYIYR